ncbi:MAG TPA: 6-phosphogluconolactonase [Nitrospirae bacterium]|nr:6-phosphogluconolactonase [bacterium BMS3Abin10]GBE37744.1 6-phosphogluconolactonase [bacterium BMS3Bbin08]HDH00347.1 6-phosphogluconolactonase [Nitrospirota bacterium]HDH51377.1 6-phosphogluconolactonase [Nitrospirota bacterium]HDK41635.1 6-phosphogluconolactonase [Nitrospirota bacterium]
MTIENLEVHIFKDLAEMAGFAIKKWQIVSGEAIKDRGRFNVALSGGKTPVTFYKQLAGFKGPMPWDKTHIFLVDERFVPYDDDKSNYRMIFRTLVKGVQVPTENIHPVSTAVSSSQTSASKYEGDLISYFDLSQDEFPKFDLMFLGIGEDGHTASLFPETAALDETRRLAVAVTPSDAAKKDRITLTFPVINNAENVIFMVGGEGKAGILKEVIEEESSQLPASRVKPARGKLFFLLDEGAGSLLSHAHGKQ